MWIINVWRPKTTSSPIFKLGPQPCDDKIHSANHCSSCYLFFYYSLNRFDFFMRLKITFALLKGKKLKAQEGTIRHLSFTLWVFYLSAYSRNPYGFTSRHFWSFGFKGCLKQSLWAQRACLLWIQNTQFTFFLDFHFIEHWKKSLKE